MRGAVPLWSDAPRDEQDAELAHIIKGGKATAESVITSESVRLNGKLVETTSLQLWDQSWDDDDVEGSFANQLRSAGARGTMS